MSAQDDVDTSADMLMDSGDSLDMLVLYGDSLQYFETGPTTANRGHLIEERNVQHPAEENTEGSPLTLSTFESQKMYGNIDTNEVAENGLNYENLSGDKLDFRDNHEETNSDKVDVIGLNYENLADEQKKFYDENTVHENHGKYGQPQRKVFEYMPYSYYQAPAYAQTPHLPRQRSDAVFKIPRVSSFDSFGSETFSSPQSRIPAHFYRIMRHPWRHTHRW